MSFLAAYRENTGDGSQTVEVSIGSTVVGTFDLTAADTDYASYSMTLLLLAAGTYALTIAGTNALGDNTAFLDAVTLAFTPTGVSLALVNPGFEVPDVGSGGSAYEYAPTGAGVGWTFGAGTGVSGNGSAFTNFNPDAPQGAQVGFLQGTGAISQLVTLAEAGSLVVSFQAAQRSNGGSVNSQQIQVSLGTSVLGAPITPTGIDYASSSTEPVAVEAGTYDLTFTGLNPMGGDNTAFLDAVTAVVTPTGGGSGGDALADNPFGYLGGLGYWQDPSLADSGLSYVRQRWLENATGQWLSVDPVATEPRYGYARNMPTMRVDPSGMFSLPQINATSIEQFLPAHARSEFHLLQAEFSHANTILATAIQQLLVIEQAASAQFESARTNFPPIIANLAPPPPWHFIELAEWIGGVIVGALQSLYGLIPIAGFIPDLISFIQYLIDSTPKQGFFASIGHYFTDQWNGLVSLFTKVADATPFERGKLFGSLLVNLVVAIIGIVVTVITAGTGAAVVAAIFEEEGQDLVKTAARLAKGAGRAIRNAPGKAAASIAHDTKTIVGHGSEIVQAVKEQRLPSGLQRHIDVLVQMRSNRQFSPQELEARSQAYLQEEFRTTATGAGYAEIAEKEAIEAYAKIIRNPNDAKVIASNTGISVKIIQAVKGHVFFNRHDIPTGPGAIQRDVMFTPDIMDADLWNAVVKGKAGPWEMKLFKRWMAHEYIELRMEEYLPFRGSAAENYTDPTDPFNNNPTSTSFGAHDVAPNNRDDPFSHYEAELALPREGLRVNDDLSNLDSLFMEILKRVRARQSGAI